jgi:hypothetical protein
MNAQQPDYADQVGPSPCRLYLGLLDPHAGGATAKSVDSLTSEMERSLLRPREATEARAMEMEARVARVAAKAAADQVSASSVAQHEAAAFASPEPSRQEHGP